MIAFRCDGGEGAGAGHVARCLQLARAFAAAGEQVCFVGAYDGAARDLLEAAGMPRQAPDPDRPAGIPAEASAAVVDSYELPDAEIAEADRESPVAVMIDEGPAPSVTAAVCYQAGAEQLVTVPTGTIALLGPAYAPLRPELLTARRARPRLEHALVSLGGGVHGEATAEPAVDTLLELDVDVFLARQGAPIAPRARLEQGFDPQGLVDRIRWADVAVAGAGTTAYELACAGVPAVLLVLADNQMAVARGLGESGAAHFVDARVRLDGVDLARAVAALGDAETREQMAAAGPALVDGRGAERLRAALAGIGGGAFGR